MKRGPVFKQGVFKPTVFQRRRPRRPHPRLKGLSINHLLPNVLTVLALCAGLTAIRFAIQERWEPAVIAIVIAAVLDALDGRIARLLNGQSKFGAELDSLADVISFGVAPALTIYLWALDGAGSLGWIATLAFPVCAALRLARFNSRLGAADLPPFAFNYFTGIPAPAGAGLALLPLVAGFATDPEITGHPALVVPWMLGIGGLMVSTIPTFSFKGVRIPQRAVVPGLVGVGLLAAFLVSQPWWTLTALGIAYLASLPFSIAQFAKLQNAAARMKEQEAVEDPDADAETPPPAGADEAPNAGAPEQPEPPRGKHG
ncbi:CDP-diacylglycerol--serine O-phosphatidyltransferase [Azospirillum halopraeferens]|uniref:CDP-diacylglycerol--serine O-phosphatidyltransferase n=1 Tax=Azospirillum halopraeferens TaxID=34010 RepID=UPI000404C24B|nr:CDP-diacylglycerol--serine O-phosphatidyltransferase [Azospirillum halopraeferens]